MSQPPHILLLKKMESLMGYLDHRNGNRHHDHVLTELKEATEHYLYFSKNELFKSLVKLGNVEVIRHAMNAHAITDLSKVGPGLLPHINFASVAPDQRAALLDLVTPDTGLDFSSIDVVVGLSNNVWACGDPAFFDHIATLAQQQNADHFSYLVGQCLFTQPTAPEKHGVSKQDEDSFLAHVVGHIARTPQGPKFGDRALVALHPKALALYLKARGKFDSTSHIDTNSGTWMARVARALTTSHGRLRLMAVLPDAETISMMDNNDIIAILGGPSVKAKKEAAKAVQKTAKKQAMAKA